jgi:hypothetical protein
VPKPCGSGTAVARQVLSAESASCASIRPSGSRTHLQGNQFSAGSGRENALGWQNDGQYRRRLCLRAGDNLQ